MKQLITLGCGMLLFVSIATQPVSAAITGTIIDAVGDPIPRALVMFTSEPDSSYVVMAVTDSLGHYVTGELPLGIEDEAPAPFALGQNYPNPFNPATTIPLTLDAPGHVRLTVYNIMGQRIRTLVDGYLNGGTHAVVWDARDDSGHPVGSGVYFYHLRYGGHSETKKMLLLDSGGVSGVSAIRQAPQSAAKSADSEVSLYTITVECFPYEKQVYEHVDVLTTTTFDATLDDAGLMVAIPGGTFQMGDEVGDLDEDCRPVHQVTLTGFEMDKYEITNEQFCAYLNVALLSGEAVVSEDLIYALAVGGEYDGMRLLQMSYIYGDNKRCWIEYTGTVFRVVPGHEDWPVVYVTWYGAKSFAVSYGRDLPTEAEWEYAARGGEQYMYGTVDGTIDSTKANYLNYVGTVSPVGSYSANPYGLYDMSGNVSEWCNDWYAWYLSESATDPIGPVDGNEKVLRGGYWQNLTAHTCRTANRWRQARFLANSIIGFRIVNNETE